MLCEALILLQCSKISSDNITVYKIVENEFMIRKQPLSNVKVKQ